ncbi:hypothetical protein AGDE_13348 [Angomonas deanei]|uniref:Minichromosome loss protein Mcl1 middle region domain-containing protein n=1 Tax=Angomonas deanei TaxID=59799 RepID=A0A7G2CEG5_9TRYP|nr:hypothetical protein AGDE_13348 [Angomonas deanei]CAD2218278.1 hypothetical protein, conserved [Angomonas deanei]|eukprot:EPY22461.1 hypothetical protein AGDE_13348 [Angomonas deanei]
MRFLSITLSVPYPLVLVLSLPRLTPETTARPPTGREKSVERGDVVFQLHKSDVVGYVEAPEEEQGALAEGERISAKCFFLANHESVSETLFVVWEGALTYVRMCLTAPPKPFLVHERKSSIRDTASKKGKPRVTSVLSKTAAASSESNPPLLLCATGQLAAPIQSSLSVDDRYVVIACQRGGVYVMDHVELYGGAAAFDSTDSAGCVSTHSKVLSAAVHKGGVCALVSSTLGTGEERQFVLACTSVSVENKAPSPPRFMTALPGEVVSAGWVGCLPLAMISIANSQTLLWDTTFHYLVGQLPITPYQSSTVRAGAAHLTYLDYATADGEVSLRPSLLPATSLTAMVYPLFAVYFPGLPVFSVAAILRQVPPTDRLTSSLSNTELASLDVQGERTEEDYDRSVPPRWGEVPADAHALRWLSHLQHSSGARKVWLDRMIEQSSE